LGSISIKDRYIFIARLVVLKNNFHLFGKMNLDGIVPLATPFIETPITIPQIDLTVR